MNRNINPGNTTASSAKIPENKGTSANKVAVTKGVQVPELSPPACPPEQNSIGYLLPAPAEIDARKHLAGRGAQRITQEELIACIADGMSVGAIAVTFGLTYQAVRKRVAKLKTENLVDVVQGTTKDGTVYLNTPEQLAWVNRATLDIIKAATTPATTKLQAIRRIEAQNELQLRLQKLITSVNEAKAFQAAVIKVIGELEKRYPDLREHFLRALQAERDKAAINLSN